MVIVGVVVAVANNVGAGATPLAYLEVKADETINVPTPISIRDIPNVSVLAKYLGNILKSTARIARQVSKTFIPVNKTSNIDRVMLYS